MKTDFFLLLDESENKTKEIKIIKKKQISICKSQMLHLEVCFLFKPKG